jgi:hypothetical protein
LSPGYTLEEAARFFADHLARTTRTLTIAEAIAEFLETKKNVRETHKRDLTTRLNRWKSCLDREDSVSSTRPVSSVTVSELAAFVAQFQGQTYINWRRVLSNFFGCCVKTGASPENPAAGLEKGSRIQRRPEKES